MTGNEQPLHPPTLCSMQLQSTACKTIRVFSYARQRTASSDGHRVSENSEILIYQADRRNLATERTDNENPNSFKIEPSYFRAAVLCSTCSISR